MIYTLLLLNELINKAALKRDANNELLPQAQENNSS